ncbi:putative beta-1,3-galactosyltransferase 12 isoform X2 [Wolffia australiana]
MPTAAASIPIYSKDDKAKKTRLVARPNAAGGASLATAMAVACFFFGIGSLALAAFALLRPPRIVPIVRCGGAEDALRTFRSKSLGIGDKDGEIVPRPKLVGLVGLLTAVSSAGRRAALRSTWFPPHPDSLQRLEQSTGLAFRFVIGRTKDLRKMEELKQEEEKHHDFLFIDVDEKNVRPPYKTHAFFKAAFKLFEAEYYIKADDNIYLRPDRLATLLAKERPHPRTYIGCMKKGPVVTDPKMKWYESSGHLIGNEYFMHAYGPIYIISADVASALSEARNGSLRIFNNEDVTFGSWMLAMDVNFEDNRAMCDARCMPTSIAVWDMPKCSGLCDPVASLKELHAKVMCSKSPTLPPDDSSFFSEATSALVHEDHRK